MPTEPSPLRPVTPLGILAHRLARLSQRIERDDGIDADGRDELGRLVELASGLDPYLESMTSPESADLADLARRTVAARWGATDDGPALEAEMLSGHVEGRLLALLVAVTGARRVLEIGMFTGYSALAMAEALPAGGSVVACEVDPGVAAFARERFDASTHGDRIEVRVGPAADTLRALADDGERFDLVFLDADKGGYPGYLRALLDDDLLAPGGLVCVDNTLLQGEPYLDRDRSANGEAIARFNEGVAADDRVEQVVLPVRDGITLIRRVDGDLRG